MPGTNRRFERQRSQMRKLAAPLALTLALLAGSAAGWARLVSDEGFRAVAAGAFERLAEAAEPLGARPVVEYVALELHAAAAHIEHTDLGALVWSAPESKSRT